MRYGLREPGDDVIELYEGRAPQVSAQRCGAGLMIGTYVLSAGYYDAYYVRAQKIRTLIKRDFETVFADGVDAILTPATPSRRLRHRREGRRPTRSRCTSTTCSR